MEKGPLSIVSVVNNTYYVIEGVWNRLGSSIHENWFEPIGGDVLVIWSCKGGSLGRREVVRNSLESGVQEMSSTNGKQCLKGWELQHPS